MKFKKLTKEQIIISLDRLTRFKPTKEKYQRVFTDIVLSCLIEPKYKKSDLLLLKPDFLKDIAVKIINSSLSDLCSNSLDSINDINSTLKKYENSIFVNDDYTQALLDNDIDYAKAITLIDDESIVNLKWLTSLKNNDNLAENRYNNCLKFPIEKVLLVEGLTEETLLPAFSKYLGYDFYKEGIQIIPAGGKNQVVKLYYKLINELKIPIFVLLDKDAEDNIRQIMPKLRSIDKIHLVSCGEFEDLLPTSLIIKTVNSHLNTLAAISEEDFDKSLLTVENLENIYKIKGIHEFKKAEFAKLVKENITSDEDISHEIAEIIMEISLLSNLKQTS